MWDEIVPWDWGAPAQRNYWNMHCHRDNEYWPPVLTKQDFVLRYKAGEFGNCSPTWNTCNEFISWGMREFGTGPSRGWFHLRNRVAGGATYYNLHWSETVARWCEQKDPSQWYVSEMAPHDKNLIQGEVLTTEQGLSLFYSSAPGLPMRDALALQSKQVCGIIALEILRYYLCPNSYDWLQELLRRYPDHVVEFSAFSVKWGTLSPLYNTCFWEVRKY